MRVKLLFRFAISIALLVLAFSITDTAVLLQTISGASFYHFLLAVFFLALSTVACAWRWYSVSKAIGLPLPFKTAVSEYFGCTFFNHVLPGGIVGDVARAWRHKEAKGLKLAAHSVIAERLLGQTTFVLFISAAIPLLLLAPNLDNRMALAAVYGAVVALYLSAAFFILTGKHLPGKIGIRIHEFHEALFEVGLKNAVKMIGISMIMVGCFILSFYFCALSLHISVLLLCFQASSLCSRPL